MYNVDSLVSATTAYLRGSTIFIAAAFGNTPQGTPKLTLKLAPPPPNISYLPYGKTGIVYTEKITNGNTTIVSPDQITFSAYYKGNTISANAPVYHTAYAIQRDQ